MDKTALDGSSTEAPQQCCREAARTVGEAAGAAMEESATEAHSSGDSAASAVSPVSAPQQELRQQQQQQQQGVKRHHHKHNLKHRYELQETLGKGTYGKVKRAIERFSGRMVAIKSIRKDKIKDEQDMIHIRREIEIMSSLSHPHIITIYEDLVSTRNLGKLLPVKIHRANEF